MKVFKDINEVDKEHRLIAVLGNFDGIHKGHMSLIEAAKELKEPSEKLIVVTFDPHPRDYMGLGVRKIQTLEEKLATFEKLGIDMVLLVPFQKVADLKPEDFVERYLVSGLAIKKVVIGFDYRFGQGATGNSKDMEKLGKKYGFDAVVLPEYMEGGLSVSSSLIRELIAEGDLIKANKLLGYNFSLTGKVVHGKGLGRQLGFPTANLNIDTDKILPGYGVYCVYSKVKKECYYGICNVGFQPTVDQGTSHLVVEVNFFNFDQDIYDEVITVWFLDYLRSITKFDSKEALIGQLKKDKEKSWEIIKLSCN